MKNQLLRQMFCIVLSVVLLHFGGTVFAENIDPDDDGSQYAYGENVGWLNLEPDGDGGSGVEVLGEKLIGYIWGENVGWISLSCENTNSCDDVNPPWTQQDARQWNDRVALPKIVSAQNLRPY